MPSGHRYSSHGIPQVAWDSSGLGKFYVSILSGQPGARARVAHRPRPRAIAIDEAVAAAADAVAMSAGVLQCDIATLRKVRVRVTTLLACSCQFTTCWGLPCRHILTLLCFLKLQGHHTILLALIAAQWLVDTESRATATTLALVSGAAAATTAAQHTASPRLTSTNRLTGLMNFSSNR